MRVTLLSFFLFLIGVIFLSAQDSVVEPGKFSSSYESYFELPRESVYLHLNKDKYIKGEGMWFKGYVYDRRSHKPFVNTTNVYLGIYDSLGVQKGKYLYYSEGGFFNGSVAIDSTFTDGKYYVKASTNWMRNFKEDDAYVQQIEVLSKSYNSEKANSTLAYDVQLLPEGGNLVNGLPNIVGVKILDDNGLGVAVKNMKLQDVSGKELVVFNTNQFGMGKFEFTPEANKSYKVGFTSPIGKEVSTALPMAYAKGVNLRLQNNPFYDKVILNIMGTAELSGDDFKLMVHKDGDFKTYPIKMDSKTGKAVFVLQKTELPHGVNTVTVFDANERPVLERLFFNNTKKDVEELSVRILGKEDDSVIVGLQSLTNKAMLNLSVSVLPENTISYNHQENIKSTFYLRPYLKGYIERPNYYFTATTPKKEYELDLLLLTQGWSRYNWFDILNKTPEAKYAFEDGMTLSVNLNNVNSLADNAKLMIHKSANHGDQILDIRPNENQIVVTNFFPQNNEELYFSMLGKKDEVKRLRAYIRLGDNKIKDKIDPDRYNFSTILSEIDKRPFNLIKDEEFILLDNVTVFGSKTKRISQMNSLVPSFLKSRTTEIDIDMARTYPLISDLIRSRGYDVLDELGSVSIKSRRGGNVLLIFDGVRQVNNDFLYRLPTAQVESFYFDRISRFETNRSQNQEALYIYTRKGKELNIATGIENYLSSNSLKFSTKKGFEPNKKYYSPAYRTFSGTLFENFGVIHWLSNFTLSNSDEETFKILDTPNKSSTLYIEGMDKKGRLVSKIKTINTSGILRTE